MTKHKIKLIRITTVPTSLKTLLKGQLRFMCQNGFDVIGVSSKGRQLDDVRNDERVSVMELEMTRTISPVKDIKALWSFYRLCRREKPMIVHSHTPKAGIVGMLGAKLAGVPIRLHTVAGLPLMEATGIKRKVLDFVERLTYGCATYVYPNSKGLYDFIVENHYTSTKKLKVIANGSSNGIDTNHFSQAQVTQEQKKNLKKELNIAPDDFVFVFVGRLVKDKGINELVAAFSKLREKQASSAKEGNSRKIRLLLVGSEERELDPLFPKTLDDIGDNPDIILVGYQKDVRPYFAISDSLVFPSYREGFPNVVMQAGAMGLPSIVTDINGCNEIINQNKNGVIIPPKNEKALLEAMEHFITHPAETQQMAENARPLITNRYEQQVVWKALLDEYRQLEKEHL